MNKALGEQPKRQNSRELLKQHNGDISGNCLYPAVCLFFGS